MALREKISKEAILEAAEKVFSQYGFHEAKIYKIAELADVSVGTIYRFFKGKEELYQELIMKKLKELQRRVDSKMRGKSPKNALNAYISTVVDFFEEERDFFTIFIREVGTGSFTGSVDFSDWYKKHVRGLAKVINRGIKSGEFVSVNPLATAISITGALRNLIYARSSGMVKGSEDLKELLQKLFLEGILRR